MGKLIDFNEFKNNMVNNQETDNEDILPDTKVPLEKFITALQTLINEVSYLNVDKMSKVTYTNDDIYDIIEIIMKIKEIAYKETETND